MIELTDERAVCEGDFTPEDCEGHFPGDPLVPGVLLLEGLAQTMLVLHQRLAEGHDPLLAGADRVRFRAAVRPPATVRYEVDLSLHRGSILRCNATAFDGTTVVCTAVLTGGLA